MEEGGREGGKDKENLSLFGAPLNILKRNWDIHVLDDISSICAKPHLPRVIAVCIKHHVGKTFITFKHQTVAKQPRLWQS